MLPLSNCHAINSADRPSQLLSPLRCSNTVVMASAAQALLSTCSLPRPREQTAYHIASSPNRLPLSNNHAVIPNRRQLLLLLTASTAAITGEEMTAKAQDIPLFGLRKKLKKAEEEAEELLKEGIETAEKGLETAEKGIGSAEMGIVAAEAEIAPAFGGFAQAGLVAGAEFLGVLLATSVVNGILGNQAQKP